MKDKEAKRFTLEKPKIEALIEKHRPYTLKTLDEVNTLGTGKNAKVDGQEGTEKGKPTHKKATKDSQIKKSHKKGIEAKNAKKGNLDTCKVPFSGNCAKVLISIYATFSCLFLLGLCINIYIA